MKTNKEANERDNRNSPPRPTRLELAALIFLLALYFFLAVSSLAGKSVTIDEFAHLPAGASYLKTGDFRLYPHNPPLMRAICALPLMVGEVKVPLRSGWREGNHWLMGYEFMADNQGLYQEIFVKARLMTVLFGAALALLAWWWARGLYGAAAGLTAALLTALCPTMMAHARLVTTDVGEAFFLSLAVFLFWRFCRNVTWPRALAAGTALGLALLVKFTSIILLGLLPALSITDYLMGSPKPPFKKALPKIAAFLAAAFITLNSGYLWHGFGTAMGDYQFKSAFMTGIAALLPDRLPLPASYDYVRGFDLQSQENEGNYPVYLLGEVSRQERVYYYPLAMAVKMTAPSILLLLFSIATFFSKKLRPAPDEIFIIAPPLVLVAGITFFTHINIGVRYVMPAFPFLFILCSRTLWAISPPRKAARAAVAALVVCHGASNLLAYPHYIPYFNLFAGGSANGYKILADSNLDWGQDLIGLKKYMEDEGVDEICLAYFGRVHPAVYGIQHRLPREDGNCDVVAVSASLLLGLPYFVSDKEEIYWSDASSYSNYLRDNPDRVIGHSIWVFKAKDRGGPRRR